VTYLKHVGHVDGVSLSRVSTCGRHLFVTCIDIPRHLKKLSFKCLVSCTDLIPAGNWTTSCRTNVTEHDITEYNVKLQSAGNQLLSSPQPASCFLFSIPLIPRSPPLSLAFLCRRFYSFVRSSSLLLLCFKTVQINIMWRQRCSNIQVPSLRHTS
jgi:hypothetical protein